MRKRKYFRQPTGNCCGCLEKSGQYNEEREGNDGRRVVDPKKFKKNDNETPSRLNI